MSSAVSAPLAPSQIIPVHIPLCSALTENLPRKIELLMDKSHSLDNKSTLFSVAKNVIILASVALNFPIANYFSTFKWGTPLTILAIFCIGIPLGKLIDFAGRKSSDYELQGKQDFAESENLCKINDQRNLIDSWNEDDIVKYMTHRKIDLPNEIALAQLASIAPDSPLRALLPLIAQDLILEKEAVNLQIRIKELRNKPERTLEEFGEIIDLRAQLQRKTLESACIRQQMQTPDHEYVLMSTPEGVVIKDILSPEDRIFGKLTITTAQQVYSSYLAIPLLPVNPRIYLTFTANAFDDRMLHGDEVKLAEIKARGYLTGEDLVGQLDVLPTTPPLEIDPQFAEGVAQLSDAHSSSGSDSSSSEHTPPVTITSDEEGRSSLYNEEKEPERANPLARIEEDHPIYPGRNKEMALTPADICKILFPQNEQ